MDKKEDIITKAAISSEQEDKSVKELKEELVLLTRKMEKSQSKLLQLTQDEQVLKQQEVLLKKNAHDLCDRIEVATKKLDKLQQAIELEVRNLVNKINQKMEKREFDGNKDVEKTRLEQRIRDDRRRKYHKLKGEIAALLLFKEYQETVIAEMDEVGNLHKHAEEEEAERLFLSYFSP